MRQRALAVEDPAAAFWAQVERGGEFECWPWQGLVDRRRRAYWCIAGGTVRAQRLAYALGWRQQAAGPVSPQCGQLTCCNPAHLGLSIVAFGAAGWQMLSDAGESY